MSIKKTFGANGGDVSLGYSLASVCGDKDKLTVTSDSTTWLTATIADGKIKITVAKNNDGNPRNGAVTPYINGTPCNTHKINIEQSGGSPEPFSCYRGTDNGTDYPTGGGKGDSHPILLCGNVDSHMTDSIYVSGGLQYYTGSTTPTEDSDWKELTETFLELPWVKLKVNKSGGCCGSGYIDIYTTEKYNTGTNESRSTKIWLRATDRSIQTVPDCAAIGCSGPAGKTLCRQWEYEIKQCSVGYVWCGEHSTDATPIPCSEQGTCVSPRGIKEPHCNCSEPPTPPTPTTCESCEDINPKVTDTHTAPSGAQDGFTMAEFTTDCDPDGEPNVKFMTSHKDGDAFVYVRQVTRMSEKKYKITGKMLANPNGSPRTEIFAIEVKNGDEYEECASFEFIQEGTATTCDCQSSNVSITPVTDLSSAGGSNIKIATITADCDPGFTFDHKDGEYIILEGDFDEIKYYLGNAKKIEANVSEYTEIGGERSETISVNFNGTECTAFTITQKGAAPAACNIHANVIGHPEGTSDVTFSCGGLTNTTGDFTLPSDSTGGTISCEKDGFEFNPKDVVVECGETGQFTVYKKVKIEPTITRFNNDSYTYSVPFYEDILDITLTVSVVYEIGGNPHNYQEEINTYFGEKRDEEINLEDGAIVNNVLIEDVRFDNGSQSKIVDNSYTNYYWKK